MTLPRSSHLMLLHSLQQGSLRLRGRAVDLVGQKHVGEDWSRHEGELASLRRLAQHLRPRDVRRHQVGRELHARELQFQDVRDRLHQQGLGQPGCPRNETMTTREEGDENLLDDLALTDDGLAQFGPDLLVAVNELLYGSGFGRGRGFGRGLGFCFGRGFHQCVIA